MKSTTPLRSTLLALCVLICLGALALLALSPVPTATMNNTFVRQGKVESIVAARGNDVQIRLTNDPRTYYMNRGTESGLDVELLTRQLEGRIVRMRVVRRIWSPLDPLHRLAPVAELRNAEEIFFPAR